MQQGRSCSCLLLLALAVLCISGVLGVTNSEYGLLQAFRQGLVEEDPTGSRGAFPLQSSGARWPMHRGRIAVTVRRRRPEPVPARVFRQRSTAAHYVYPVAPATTLLRAQMTLKGLPDGPPGRWSAYRLAEDSERPSILCLRCPSVGRSCVPVRCNKGQSKNSEKFPWRGLIMRMQDDEESVPPIQGNCTSASTGTNDSENKSTSTTTTTTTTTTTALPDCEPLTAPSDGSLECSGGFSAGSICSFACSQGFQVDGYKDTLCQHRKWTQVPPLCITEKKLPEPPPESCSSPRRPRQGLVYCEGLGVLAVGPKDSTLQETPCIPPGTVCKYFCQAGHEIPSDRLDEATILCLGTAWNETLDLHCQASHCVTPLPIEHGNVKCWEREPVSVGKRGDQSSINENHPRGTKCSYVCKAGYTVPTNQRDRIPIQCMAPHWNTTITPQCKQKLPPVINCSTQEYFTKATREVSITLPTATAVDDESGSPLEVECRHSSTLGPGHYLNLCNATDPLMGTTGHCQYNITVTAVCNAPPSASTNGIIKCGPGLTEQFSAGTICNFVCSDNYTVPASQQHLVTAHCSESSLWNSSRAPDCLEQVPPKAKASSCQNLTMELSSQEDSEVNLPVPEFTTAGGRPAKVTCLLTSVSKQGLYENLCSAHDPELDTRASCSYTAEITLKADIFVTEETELDDFTDEVLGCPLPMPPTNGQLSCSEGGVYECQLRCDPGHSLQPSGVLIERKIRCDNATGIWDYQQKGLLLPDCLGELPTTLLVAPLHFNVTVPSCEQKQVIEDIVSSVREQLTGKNKDTCDSIICSHFEHLCHPGLGNESAILVITWTVQASFAPQDYEYSEDVPEAESNIDKVRSSANRMVTSSPDFKQAVHSLGGILIPESYQQGFFRLVCEKLGYVVDHLSDTCIECPPGSHQVGDECETCPKDTYQSKTGQTDCLPCPPGLGTASNGTRAIQHCIQDSEKMMTVQWQ